MTQIRWDLLGAPVNVAAAVNAGFERGREMRLRGQQESAFGMLARDPNSAEGRALLVESGRPDLARQFRQWGREDRREEMWRSAFGGATPTPQPSALAPAGAPVGAVPGTEAPAQPSAPTVAPAASQGPGQLNPELMRRFMMEDPEGARELLTTWNSLNDMQRAEQTRRFAAAVPILSEVALMPVSQRGQAVLAQAPFLIQNGWTQEQIQAFAADPNDQSIRMLLRMGVPIAEQRQFFAPIEGGPGNIYRDPVTLGVQAANPAPPRTEQVFDAQGNQYFQTVPGTPAIGPDANLFGQGATVQPTLEQLPTVATPQEASQLPPGTRFRDPEGNIRTVPGGPQARPAGNFPPGEW